MFVVNYHDTSHLPQLPHPPQRHHPLTAGPPNLLPPALIHPQPLRHRLAGNPSPLQLPPPGVEFPPAGRYLDQKTPIPQEVVHLAVGVAGQAGVDRKPTRSGFRRTHKLQQDAHTSWPQILGQRADPPSHKRCRQRGHTAQAATGGYPQTALLELRVIGVDIKLIAVGALADHQCWTWLDVGPIREREGHQNDGKASQHQAATTGSPSLKL
jgi:hypothetical protein